MATYKTIHTSYGLQQMAAAEATGTPINLTHMAVGDGNGNFTTPDQGQTQLVHEIYRHTVNRVFQDPDVPTMFSAELIIPASVGGFTMREVGIFDADGSLFAVGNLPPSYKPNDAEGSYVDSAVRIQFLVTNADIVTIQVDPNVAVATQTWITNNVTAAFLLPGGTTGQVLTKNSNADGDTKWSDPTDVNVLVNTVEESQTLAAGQTVVNLATTTTQGLAVYVEGVRLPKDASAGGWQPDGAIITRLTLGKSYVDGTQIICVQNEPASNLPDALAKPQNLADLLDKAVARANLDVFSKAEASQLQPVSAVVFFPRSTAPTGWLKANGAAISRTVYANLWAAIGTTFGIGDGFTTFNLPDLRGEFVRGWDDARGVDGGRAIGSVQSDELRSHTHSGSTLGVLGTGPIEDGQGNPNWSLSSIGYTGGSETRPRNVALLACIKF